MLEDEMQRRSVAVWAASSDSLGRRYRVGLICDYSELI